MSTGSKLSLVLVLAASLGATCEGPPYPGSELDGEETFAEYCANLFACPEVTFAEGIHGTHGECVDVHRRDYEQRDTACRLRVLVLEDCLATLTCSELQAYREESGSTCDEARFDLLERCAPL